MDDAQGTGLGRRTAGTRGTPAWRPRSLPTGDAVPTSAGARHLDDPDPDLRSWQAPGPFVDNGPDVDSGRDVDWGAVDDLAVRPFLLTGGRTRPARDDLRVESLIQSAEGAPVGALRFEARRIHDLCRRPTSVAEVAAALRVPLGVTRILVSDLIAAGHVMLVENEALSLQMLERIRDRVRAL